MKQILMHISKEVRAAVNKMLGGCMDDEVLGEDFADAPVPVAGQDGTQLYLYYKTRTYSIVSRSPEGRGMFKIDNNQIK